MREEVIERDRGHGELRHAVERDEEHIDPIVDLRDARIFGAAPTAARSIHAEHRWLRRTFKFKGENGIRKALVYIYAIRTRGIAKTGNAILADRAIDDVHFAIFEDRSGVECLPRLPGIFGIRRDDRIVLVAL